MQQIHQKSTFWKTEACRDFTASDKLSFRSPTVTSEGTLLDGVNFDSLTVSQKLRIHTLLMCWE